MTETILSKVLPHLPDGFDAEQRVIAPVLGHTEQHVDVPLAFLVVSLEVDLALHESREIGVVFFGLARLAGQVPSLFWRAEPVASGSERPPPPPGRSSRPCRVPVRWCLT